MSFNCKPITSMLLTFRQALACQAGVSAISFAVAAPALITAVGLASDISIATMKKAELQSLADQAAIASANELSLGKTSKSVLLETASAFVDASSTGSNRGILKSAEIGDKNSSVTVTLTENWTPMFAHFVGFDVTPIVADATASLAGQTNICVLALSDAEPKTLHMDNSAKLAASGCGIYSNSKHSQGLRLDQNSSVKASLVCSAGGVKARQTSVSPTPSQDCPVINDPLASRTAPKIGSCDQTNLVLSSGTHVLSPGTYCGGLRITGTAEVKFTEGTYIIEGGAFDISGNAKVEGDYAGFYLSGAASTLRFDGDADIRLKGARTGEMAGLLFFEDRSAPLDRTHRIRSTMASEMTGTLYLSRGNLRVDPNGQVGQDSAYTAIVVRKLQLAEGPTLVMNSDYSSTSVPVPTGIRSAATVVLSK
jgi:Flp pilus assembly protein TadG